MQQFWSCMIKNSLQIECNIYLFLQYFKQSVVNKTIIKCNYLYILFDMNKEEGEETNASFTCYCFDDIGTDRK